ncbi:endolytic transglycosylase MltG [Novosphingobium bradum]|uniref:Endolytic murein transglycosylase n=1 Tax=Novosphingobium bradum TaxID=1737444 RepID=A0ABV7IPZ3_9SPHN
MGRRGKLLVLVAAALALAWGLGGWFVPGPLGKDAEFVVRSGDSFGTVVENLSDAGAISSPLAFKLRARLLGGGAPIKAGTFLLPSGASQRTLVDILQGGRIIRRFVTVPEGMPSIMVAERLAAQPNLTGDVATPPEGSVLPDTYEIGMGESRQAVVLRMQAAMQRELKALWVRRSPSTVAKSPEEALVLASIVEKETGKPAERAMVAGLYSNRLRQGMMLQADPTIIYPITRGKPLGRRIRQSEIAAVNGYNTYSMVGLPEGPITNPGRASIEAVLDPAPTDALYMVADGTGGHAFAATLEEHNRNVAKWFALRRARGEL